MRRPVSDAIVFFGATGDLAYKQIFPALQGLIRDEGLDIPIIGVAKAGWSLDQLKARAKDSLCSHGGLDIKAFGYLEKISCYGVMIGVRVRSTVDHSILDLLSRLPEVGTAQVVA
jgi:glucose-6-phosphate 1-dehydrogenase